MNDTIRTDTLLIAWDFTPEPKVMLNHARQLERELDEAHKRIKQLEDAGDEMRPWCSDKKSYENWDNIREKNLYY